MADARTADPSRLYSRLRGETSARARHDAWNEVIVGEGIEVRYGDRPVLAIERIGLREGEILAVLGPNGAGKSTLLRVLAMLESPASGSVRYRGEAGAGAEAALRRSSAAVFQRPHVWAGSVGWNVELGLRLGRTRAAERRMCAEEAARQLGIEHLLDADARSLSGGEMQRVAIARALALDPDVLFLDEPTANLDAEVRLLLREDLERAARSRGRATLLATHDRNEAFYLADRVTVLREGRVVQVGTPAELFEDPRDPFIAETTGAELSLRGTVAGEEGGLLQVDVDGVLIRAIGNATRGAAVKLAYRPEDLLLSKQPARLSSARNRFAAVVADVREAGGLLRVRMDGPPEVIAVVTRAAGRELGLAPGTRVFISIKATAVHAFPL
ncbi:MAG: ABC transporter ATP-binding protein [Gemmatimonadota bacterium]